MENPFEVTIKRLAAIEAQQAALLKLLHDVGIKPANTREKPITTEEAAKLFGVTKYALYQHSQDIKHVKRFSRYYWYPSDLQDYLDAGKNVS